MEVLRFSLYENVAQAKAILKKIQVELDDQIYQDVRKLLQGAEGYVGLFTRLAYGLPANYKKNPVRDERSAATMDQLNNLKKALDEKKHVFEYLLDPITGYDTYEDIIDAFEFAKIRYKARQIYNEFPRDQKRLIANSPKEFDNYTSMGDEENQKKVSLMANLYDHDNKQTFLTKISKYKNDKDLFDKMTQFLNATSSESFQENLDEIDYSGAKVIHKDRLDDLIIVEVDYRQCSDLGGDTSWCIVGDRDMFKSYAEGLHRKQYIIYLTDKKFTDNLRKIGATFDVAYHTAHGVEDNYVSFENLKKLLADHDFDIAKLGEPLENLKPEDYDKFTVAKLSMAGMSLREVAEKKPNISARELTNFTKQELVDVGLVDKINFNDVELETLFKMGFDRDEVLSKKEWGKESYGTSGYYDWVKDLKQVTAEERRKYDIYNKLDWEASFEDLRKARVPRKMILDRKTDWDSHDVKHLNNEEILIHVDNFTLANMLADNKGQLNRAELIRSKKKFYDDDLGGGRWANKHALTEEELEQVKDKILADTSEIHVQTLLNKLKLDKETVLKIKTKYTPKDLNDNEQYYRNSKKLPYTPWQLTKEEILEHDLINKSPDGISGQVLTKFNKDEIEDLGLLNKLTKGEGESGDSVSIKNLADIGYTRDELSEKFGGKDKLKEFINTYTNDIELYEKKIEKTGEEQKKNDYNNDTKTLVEQIRTSKGSYEADVEKSLTAFKFSGLTKEDIPFDDRGWKTDFKSLVDRPKIGDYQKIVKFMKEVGYWEDLGSDWEVEKMVTEWFLGLNYQGSNLDGLIELYEAGFKMAYIQASRMAHNHRGVFDDYEMSKLKKFLNEPDYEDLVRYQDNKVFLLDMERAAGYQFGSSRSNDKTKVKVPYNGKQTEAEKFVEVYEPILSKHMDFQPHGDLVYNKDMSNLKETIISLILILAHTNKFEYLENIEYYGWDKTKKDVHEPPIRELAKTIVNKNFANSREEYKLQSELTDEQRRKIYTWIFRYIREGEAEGETYDWQWDQLIVPEYLYNRDKFNESLEEIKGRTSNRKRREQRWYKSGEEEPEVVKEKQVTCRICVLKPLIQFLKSEYRFDEFYELVKEFAIDKIDMNDEEIKYSIKVIDGDWGYGTMKTPLDEKGEKIPYNKPGGTNDMKEKIREVEKKALKIFLGDRYEDLKDQGEYLYEKSKVSLKRFHKFNR